MTHRVGSLTFADVEAKLQAVGITIKRDTVSGEYRVAPNAMRWGLTVVENMAYYTPDLDDALATGLNIGKELSQSPYLDFWK